MGDMPPDAPLVRTAQVPGPAWASFVSLVETEGAEGFRAYVRFMTDARYLGADEAALRTEFGDQAVIFVADDDTFAQPGHPVLCLDPEGQSASFRVPVAQLWVVENNVSIGNLLFEEAAEAIADF